jgi:hypothetical protein
MADENEHQATDESLPPDPSKESFVNNPHTTTEKGKRTPKNCNNPPKPIDAEHKINRRIMLATWIIAGATCIYGFFAFEQWWTMSGQLEQMRGSSTQNDKLICQTRKLAENAGKQATNTKILANATKDEVAKLKSLVDAANKQNNAMNQQLMTMQKQLEMTDRPWIRVTLETTSPLTFLNNNTMFNVNFRIRMKNIGHSVANKVVWASDAFLFSSIHDDPFKRPLERQKLLLNKLSSSTEIPEYMESESIFPDEERVNSSSIGGPIDPNKFPKFPGRSEPTPVIEPWIVGCVMYQFPSSVNRHYTCFNYRVVERDPSKNLYWGVIHVGHDLPADRVFLDPENWGGRFAN